MEVIILVITYPSAFLASLFREQQTRKTFEACHVLIPNFSVTVSFHGPIFRNSQSSPRRSLLHFVRHLWFIAFSGTYQLFFRIDTDTMLIIIHNPESARHPRSGCTGALRKQRNLLLPYYGWY
jgi:hypothetical protein